MWFLLPILGMTAFGVSQASNTPQVYQSTGTLSASTNPLVPELSATGANVQWWEGPAAATSRIINERLSTNTFIAAVAEQAGLRGAIDAGLIDLGVVRAAIWASPNGDSILSINAQWNDAQTSYQLVAATISQYEAFITETVAGNSSEAVTYYSEQLDSLQAERDTAERALTDYIAGLAQYDDDATYPIGVQIEVDRLTSRLDAVESQIAAAEAKIDEARLQESQQTTQAGRSFTVVDEPRVSGAPQSTLMKRVMIIAAFLLMGVVIAAAALLLTTVLDQTVASPADLLALGGVALVATVPPVRLAGHARSRRWRARRRRAGRPIGTAA